MVSKAHLDEFSMNFQGIADEIFRLAPDTTTMMPPDEVWV
jgi:hypothetical protein